MLTIPFARSRTSATVHPTRWAAVPTVAMALANLPFAFDDGDMDLPKAVAVLVSVLGVLGLAAAVGLLRRAPWGAPAVFVVGVINAIGGGIALAAGEGTGAVGVVLGLLAAALACVPARGSSTR
jgi:hypothetical protein